MRALAHPSQADRRAALAQVLFQRMDTDRSGTVEPAELVRYCRAIVGRAEAEAQAQAQAGGNRIAAGLEEEEELEAGMGSGASLQLEAAFCRVLAGNCDVERLASVFEMYDNNGDGRLQLSEFRRMADKALIAASSIASV